MDPSRALLNSYVINRSEPAFKELVDRQMTLVYGAALRRTGGDEAVSREITQTVFIDLARKAGAIPVNVVVSAWLYRHTGFVCAQHGHSPNGVQVPCMKTKNHESD